ncbi:MAG: NAD-dependent epimerase/dehydratase family protein [Bacteroidota bacterium]
MEICIITGCNGLIGSESVKFFSDKFDAIVGIDNNMREYFFGKEASTLWVKKKLEESVSNFKFYDTDIRNTEKIDEIFNKYNEDIKLVIHTAAQPSHDWAAREPLTDFSVNATGTLNLLEATRKYAPQSVFIFTSTNKVYGDTPNFLPLVETETRFEIEETHRYFKGIDESMSIDQSKHSLFGASKVAADILVQEYGKYFGLKSAAFRGGCLTGSMHAAVPLHGFLSYLMKCVLTGKDYTVFGYKGKQVRDNIHSSDLVNMFWNFYQKPLSGEVFNAGGGRFSNCSMTEAIRLCEEISEKKLKYVYTDDNRIGDHIWYISDLTKFSTCFPGWSLKYNIKDILVEIFEGLTSRVH